MFIRCVAVIINDVYISTIKPACRCTVQEQQRLSVHNSHYENDNHFNTFLYAISIRICASHSIELKHTAIGLEQAYIIVGI